MKTLRMYKGELRWFTELGFSIASNDLLNEIRACVKDYNEHHRIKPHRKKRQ